MVAETIVKDRFRSTSWRRDEGRGIPRDSALARPSSQRLEAASSLRPGRRAVTWERIGSSELDDELIASGTVETAKASPANGAPARRTQRHVPRWVVAILALAAGMAIGTVVSSSRSAEPVRVDDTARLHSCAQALDVAKERALLGVSRGAAETRMLVAANDNDGEALRHELDQVARLREQDVAMGQRFNEQRTACETR